jgi:hypothetical protein
LRLNCAVDFELEAGDVQIVDGRDGPSPDVFAYIS